MKQFVYSLDTNNVTPEEINTSFKSNMVMIDSFGSFIKNSSMLCSHFGAGKELFKLLLKISFKRSSMYCSGTSKTLHSHGVITYGRCKHYPVDLTDAVIGPVFTHPNMRGQGLATQALVFATHHINANSQSRRIIIDTSEDNYGMQTAIKRAGFAGPIKEFQRNDR
ncbi:GNAT family N-acetyltransferase [Agarivorans sp. 1_MG-2023]|uniref:GNAT family N-acetyltransferase n=1 Tax=Agarivorans sp. 1_MG-2023 TaxID=3062634 RepID=UPI0026E19C8C|nr:GNAT family N-acetyltransferase [Agarivorans sp. 1_MG-2023]MDO6762354.1 GNAT family N-acetyltransferase [Agarivorans sp. 1_MG-2023]